MMAEEGLSLEDQQKMKVSFAEGYMAGQGNKNPSKTVKWLKVLQHILTIVLFIGIFISLMGKKCFKLGILHCSSCDTNS